MPVSIRNTLCAALVASCTLLASAAPSPEHDVQQQAYVRSTKFSRRLSARNEVGLDKRGATYSGRATYYAAGLGACGHYNSGSDFIVALNAAQYGNLGAVSSWCGKTIAITYNGNTQYATVADACPSCPYGGLDMSSGLFSSFTSLGTGVFQMTWTLADGSGGSASTSNNHNNNNNGNGNGNSTPKTTSTYSPPAWTPKPKPSTTSSSTPAWTPKPTTSSSSTSTQSTRTSTSTTSSAAPTSSASTSKSASTPETTDDTADNLSDFALIYQGLNHMAVAAAN